MDIAAFIAARLDEDEAIARHVVFNSKGRDRWEAGAVTYRDGYAFVAIHTPDGLEIAGAGLDGTGGVHGEVFATHIARHDPARVLAVVVAKRKLLEFAADYASEAEDHYGTGDGPVLPDTDNPVLRLLAAPYADHPDYDPAWAVE